MTFDDLDNLDHDPGLAAALGNMVVAWARAETALVKAYALVAKIHYNLAASAYYRIPTFESRVKVLLALIEEQQDTVDRREELAKAVEKLAKLSSARNKWVHGLWMVERGTDHTFVIPMREPASTRRGRQIKAHDVEDHVSAVRRRTTDLEAFSPLTISLQKPKRKSP